MEDFAVMQMCYCLGEGDSLISCLFYATSFEPLRIESQLRALKIQIFAYFR